MTVSGMTSGETAPPEWKAMDDFAAGIDGNRLARTGALAGTSLTISEEGLSPISFDFRSPDEVTWQRADGAAGTDWYEAIEVRPELYYLTITDNARPLEAKVVIIDRAGGRTLTVESVIADAPTPGKPRVSQHFRPGTVQGVRVTGDEPAPTRDLIGLRALYRYSPNHLYEHVYLSSERYAWQCIVGEQRGHGDVDLATTWRFAEGLYVFTFREFKIPVAATWLYDMDALRNSGTFVGLRGDGRVMVAPGGAFIELLGRVTYADEQPV